MFNTGSNPAAYYSKTVTRGIAGPDPAALLSGGDGRWCESAASGDPSYLAGWVDEAFFASAGMMVAFLM